MDKNNLNTDIFDWIRIFDERGTPIVVLEHFKEGKKDMKDSMLWNLLTGLRMVSAELTYNEIKIISMGNNQFYLTKEPQTEYTFIFKLEMKNFPKNIVSIINEIRDLYLNKYLKLIDKNPRLKQSYLEDLKEDIKDIMNWKEKDINSLIE